MQRGLAIVREEIPPEQQAEFDRIFRAERELVRRHVVYLTGNPALAEDITQEAYGRLLDRLLDETAEALHSPRSWLLTVASNLAYNHMRGEARRIARENLVQASPAMSVTADSSAEVIDVVDVRRALDQLEPRDRVVLMLRHSGFTYAEIAEAVGVAPASVGTTLARAQGRFKEVYVGRSDATGEE